MLLVVPVALIVKQPDLGTAMLVLSAGFYVIFFAGLSWKLILPVGAARRRGDHRGGRLGRPHLPADVSGRCCTTTSRTASAPCSTRPRIRSARASTSSRARSRSARAASTGKGWLKGTQTHLEFIPERTTDFIFAVFSEEFGLVGCVSLLLGFLFLIVRGLMIAANAPTLFTRLLAGAITLSFFTYAFVNMGMVSGILPVVGVPLPFMSYGGTALVTLGLGLGILMSIAKSRRLVQS